MTYSNSYFIKTKAPKLKPRGFDEELVIDVKKPTKQRNKKKLNRREIMEEMER